MIIYNFNEEKLIEICKRALQEGYSFVQTIWYDSYEREEGVPSGGCTISKEEVKKAIENEDIFEILPENPGCGGCAELNFIKKTEYIEFYHVEDYDEFLTHSPAYALRAKRWGILYV